MDALGGPRTLWSPPRLLPSALPLPIWGMGLLATCSLPWSNLSPSEPPYLQGSGPRPSCALFIALLRKMVWQDTTHSQTPPGLRLTQGYCSQALTC